MLINVHENFREYYTYGALDYALSCMIEQGDFYKYAEWLKTQPVSSFLNVKDWYLDGEAIVYDDKEDEKEYYAPTASFLLNGQVILHSVEAHMSYFFLLNEDNTLDALYVD